jgi:hypothetical protein
MRPISSIAAAMFLMAAAIPTAGHADGMPPTRPARPGCHCPPMAVRHVWHARHVMHYRRRVVRRIALAPAFPIYFNWVIPSTTHPGYDRAMVLLGRSPAVSGVYTDDPGVPTTPMVIGIEPFQYATGGGAVFQYDTITGQYIQLSREDAARTVPIPPPVPLTP